MFEQNSMLHILKLPTDITFLHLQVNCILKRLRLNTRKTRTKFEISNVKLFLFRRSSRLLVIHVQDTYFRLLVIHVQDTSPQAAVLGKHSDKMKKKTRLISLSSAFVQYNI